MLYFFQTIVYAALFYLLYQLLLKNRPVHRFNRIYLLLCAVVPFLLPFATWNRLSMQDSPIARYLDVRMPEVVVSDAELKNDLASSSDGLLLLYIIVSCSLLLLTVYKWTRLRQVIRKAGQVRTPDYTLLTNSGYGPGSWGRYIFLQEDTADERIIEHEAAHVRLKHTYDLGFLSLWNCIFWCNPFVHIVKRELQQVHEFEADAAVQTDRTSYQYLLLSHFLKQCQLPFTHSFINHPIKRRIMMLNKKINAKNNSWRIALIAASTLFVAGNIVWLQSCKNKTWEVNGESNTYVANKAAAPAPSLPPQPSVNISEFLARNIRYPEAAKKANVEGKVIVKFTVNTDGSVTDAQVVKSPNELLSQEAMRVIHLMPAWTPGEDAAGNKVSVQLTQPITFQLGRQPSGSNAFKRLKSVALKATAQKRVSEPTMETEAVESEAGNAPTKARSYDREMFDREMEARQRAFNRMAYPFQTPNEGC